MKCKDCPVPGGEQCRSDRFHWFCDYASTRHPIRLKVVLNRSRMLNSSNDTTVAFQDAPGETHGAKMIDDPVVHQNVYSEARDCPHKESVQMCCGPVELCGKAGRLPGRVVQIMDCYGCVRKRKGV